MNSLRSLSTATVMAIAVVAASPRLAAQKAPATQPAIPALASSETERLLSLDGETVRVTGLVDSARRSPSGHQFLDFAASEFMTVTFRTDLDKFTEGLPADRYDGKTVAITGPIKIYKGVPEIILNDPSLIEIIAAEEAVVPPPPPAPEKKEEPEPEPAEPDPAPKVADIEAPEEKPPVDWRLYFPTRPETSTEQDAGKK